MHLWFHRNSVDFKNQHNFGVYDLYGKGSLTGCDLRGDCLVSFLYKKKAVCFKETFFCSFLISLFLCITDQMNVGQTTSVKHFF